MGGDEKMVMLVMKDSALSNAMNYVKNCRKSRPRKFSEVKKRYDRECLLWILEL